MRFVCMSMVENLAEEYPEAAPHIQQAVEEHGEDWVIENYFPEIAQLGTMMEIPSIEELPFYDEEKHDVPSEQEKQKRAEAYSAYLDNLRTGTKPREK